MKNTKVARIISLVLAIVLALSVFSGVFTVSAACNHSYEYTLTQKPSESANGSRHGVCTLCGNEVDETIQGMLTDISYTPDAGYNYGTTHDVVGAVLPEQPTVDTALDFVKDLGGKEGNNPENAAHNTTVLNDYIQKQISSSYANKVEVVTHVYFGEGTFYFAPIESLIWQDDAWRYYGRFTLDGIKGKTKLIVDDISSVGYGMFTSPADKSMKFYVKFTDINFTTRTYDTTGKPSKTMNFVDGGVTENGGNHPLNLENLEVTNCVVSGFNSIFTGCTSIAGPYLSNSDYIDFGDTFFQGCGLVDMKVTNNVIKAYGYETSGGFEPSYFQAASAYCSGIISNNKLYNMQFDGPNRSGRRATTGATVTPFANNYCEKVYGVKGVQTSTGNDFVDCSKQDMIDFLKKRGTVAQTYLDQDVYVIEMSSVANRYSSDDMTGTYLLSSTCNEALDNAYNFGKIGCDHLFGATAAKTNGDDVNIDLSMFPLSYIPHGVYYSGTHLNLNGKSVYSRYHKNASTNGNTSLFDEFGNEVAFVKEETPDAKTWTNGKSNGSYEVLSDGRIKIKASKVLSLNSGTGSIAKFVIDGVDTTLYRRYFIDSSKIELVSGDYTTLRYLVTITNSEGKSLANMPITSTMAGTDGYIVGSGSTAEAAQYGKMTVTLQIDSAISSESNPLEVIVPPIQIEKYNGMSTGDATTLNTFDTATDYSVVGSDYDKLYADIDKATSFASPEKIEEVYFNKTYGHLRTFEINGATIKDDTLALQTALNDIKDTNKELVLEEDTYHVMYNMTLAKNGIKSGSLYLEGGSTYRIRALGEAKFGFISDMNSGAMFFQKGEGEVSGYMINIDTTDPFSTSGVGCVFDSVNFKNFMFDDCILGGAYSLFENCTLDSCIYQGGYLAKSSKVFNNSTVTNSSIINNYVHIGWVQAEGLAQENAKDAGWLFYDSAFLNSTYQDNWCEYIRFNNGGWYEQNGYKASNSLYTGNILDYTVEIRLGYGDIAIGNGNYHCSKWDLMYNDKNVPDMTYDIVNRSVGTYHISSGVTVIGNSFTGTATVSPAIYFEGATNAANADGTKAIKNATVFGNNYTYASNVLDTENSVFAIEGEVAETVPSLDLDRENSLYKKLDVKGSTGNFFDYAQVNFVATPNYIMPGTVIQSGEVMGVIGYNAKTGKSDILTPSGASTGLKPITADMVEDLETFAYYNNGSVVWPEFTLKDGDYELKYGVDYTVITSAANVREGYILRIEGIGKYYGTYRVNFAVVKAPLELANVKLSYTTTPYDGSAKTPEVVFAYYNHANIASEYDLTYSSHNDFGKCYAILTAKETSAKFTGSKRVEFNVTSNEYQLEEEYVVDPTCTDEGYTSYFCWHCFESVQADFVPATGHDMQVVDQKAATCTAEGYIKTACGNGCGLSETQTIEKAAHVNRFYETPATCTTSGETARRCINCGDNYVRSSIISAKGHGDTYERIEKGTCKTAGQIQQVCEDCDEVLSYEALPLNTSEHAWVVNTMKTAPTCTATGLADATCSACGTHSANAVIPATGHTPGEVVVAGGTRYTKCSVCFGACDKEFIYDWDFTNTSTGAQDAAEFKAEADLFVNSGKNYYDSKLGSYVIPYVSTTTTSAAVFDAPANSTHKSFDVSTVGDVYNNCVSVPGVVFAKDENGIYTYNLYIGANCVTENIYYIPYTKSGTTVTGFGLPWELTTTQNPNATIFTMVDGRKQYVSSIYETFGFMPGVNQSRYATCNYHLTVKDGVVSVYADVDFCFDLVKDADPTEFSLVTATKTFSLDSIKANAANYYGGKYSSSTSVTHNKYEVAFGVYQYTRSAPNSSTQAGFGEIKGATLAYATEVDCEHTSTKAMSATAATCTENGREAGTVCADCGIIMTGGAVIPALGHNYKETTVKATCTTAGKVTTTCSRCDYNEVTSIPATGHNYSAYVVTKAATCTEEGVKTSTCSGCGDKVTESIPATGHNFSNPTVTKPATCEAEGTMTGTCSTCGQTTSEVIPALGHDLKVSTVAATCTESGTTTTSCSRCDYSSVETIAATGHSYGEWVIDKAATVTSAGSKHKTCSACGDIVTETIPATGGTMTSTDCDWDFTGANAAEDAAEMLQGSTHYAGNSVYETTNSVAGATAGYNSSTGAFELGVTKYTNAFNAIILGTPSGGTPKSFSVAVGSVARPAANALYTGGVVYATDDNNVYFYNVSYFGGFKAVSYYRNIADTVSNADGFAHLKKASATRGLYQDVKFYTIKKNGEIVADQASGLNTAGLASYANFQKNIATDLPAAITTDMLKAAKTYYDVKVVDGVTTITTSIVFNSDANSYEIVFAPTTATSTGITTLDSNYKEVSATYTSTNYTTAFGVAQYGQHADLPAVQVYSVKADFGGSGTHTHSYAKTVTAPTCEAEGYTTYTCTCGDSYVGDKVAALGHDLVTTTVDATCTKAGSTTTSCSRCDYSSVATIPAKGHTESGWIVDKEATETEAGSKHTECTVCGEVIKTESIPATGGSLDYILGDANGDGKTTILDAVSVAKYTSNLVSLDATALKAADVNGDGKTTIIDAVIMAKYTSKVIDKFPIEN